MTEDNPRAVVGDNRRGLMEVYREQNEALPAALAHEFSEFVLGAQELKLDFAAAPEVVADDETEKALTALGGRLSKMLKSIDTQRKLAKAPTLTAGTIIDTFFSQITGVVYPCMGAVERRVNAYKDEKRAAERRRQEEEARKAREAAAEAARLRDEAARLEREQAEAAQRETSEAERCELEEQRRKTVADAAALQASSVALEKSAAKVATTTVSADSGTKSVQATRWVGEITDLETLDLEALRPYIARPELDRAVSRFVAQHKDTRPLTGAKISEKSSTAFKG